MPIEIKHRVTGVVLRIVEAETLSSANLWRANLWRANLSSADLRGANLRGARGVISFGPVGEKRRIGYAVRHVDTVMVKLGCFWGAEIEARRAIEEKYGEGSTYAALVSAACRAVTEDNG